MHARIMRNVIGPQVRRLRCAKSWSQEALTSMLREQGWNICRQRVARIEACEAWVGDFEMLLIARTLGVEMQELVPKMEGDQPLYAAISDLLSGQVKKLMDPEEILVERADAQLLLIQADTILSRIADKRNDGMDDVGP
jgi:hypothetical protein